MENKVSERYLTLRERVLRYSYRDMNLSLDNDEQVYIAVFDIPLKSNIIGFQTQTLALVFGLNTHIYHGSGNVMVDLEKNAEVMKAMQSVLISSHQVLGSMEKTENIEYYESKNVRVYLKTKKGIYFKELGIIELVYIVLQSVVKPGITGFFKIDLHIKCYIYLS